MHPYAPMPDYSETVANFYRYQLAACGEDKHVAVLDALWFAVSELLMHADTWQLSREFKQQIAAAIVLLASLHHPEALFYLAHHHQHSRIFFGLFEVTHVRRTLCLYANFLMMSLPLSGLEENNHKHRQAIHFLNSVAAQAGKYQSLAMYLLQAYKEMIKQQINVFDEVFKFDKDLDGLLVYFNRLPDEAHVNLKLYQAGKYDALRTVSKKYQLVDSNFIPQMLSLKDTWQRDKNAFLQVVRPVARKLAV